MWSLNYGIGRRLCVRGLNKKEEETLALTATGDRMISALTGKCKKQSMHRKLIV